MITAVLILVTAVGLGIGAWHAARLTRGAPRSERWVWALVAILLALGTVQRVVLGIRTLGAEDIQLTLGIQVSLAVSSVTVALVLSWIHPVLRRYREADAARRQSDERLRRALSGASNPIGIADAGGRWIYTNDAGCTFFGYPREQILGRPFRDFLAGSGPTTTSGVEVAREQGSARIIREVIRGDGTHVTVQCDLIPFENDSVLIIGHDLTAQQEADAARTRVQRLEAVSSLAGGIAHDFGNLLSIIGVTLGLTAEEGRSTIPLDRALRANERARQLTRELVNVSKEAVERANQPAPKPIDIRPFVSDAVEAMRVGLDERIALTFDDVEGPLVVRASPSDIDRICMNLLVNARDAVTDYLEDVPGSPTAASIHVSLGSEGQAGNGGSTVEITVEDSGAGVPENIRERIFEPRFSTKSPGRGDGLGLAVTKELVLGLAGTIETRESTSGGAAFTVRIPQAQTTV